MSSFNAAVKPINTIKKKVHEVKYELKNFLDLWEDSGKNLRSEFIANNNGCRIVVVFDWETYERSISTK